MLLPSLRRLATSPGRKRMALFLRVCGRWLQQGMAPAQMASGLAELYRGRAEGRIALGLLQALRAGQPLAAGLAPWLDNNNRHRLLAIQRSANFAEQLEVLAAEMLANNSLSGAMFGRLGYGVLLVASTAAVLILVVHGEVLPAVSASGMQTQPSLEMLVLRTVSSHLAHFWWLWPLALALLAAAIWLALRHWVGLSRRWCDSLPLPLPLLRWYRLQLGAGLLHNLAFLVRAGDTWLLACDRLLEDSPPYCRMLLLRFQTLLTEGRGPVTALDLAGLLAVASRLQLVAVAQHPDLPLRAAEIAKEQSEAGMRQLAGAVRLLQLLLYMLAAGGLFLVLSAGRALSDPSAQQLL